MWACCNMQKGLVGDDRARGGAHDVFAFPCLQSLHGADH